MRRRPPNDPSRAAAATTLRNGRAGELAKGPPMSTSTPAADRPYPLLSLIAFSTVGIPLAGMLLAFGLFTPRYYITLLHNGGKEAVAATALVGLAFGVVRALDICIDPLVALGMDRNRTPIGRYRPWMLLGLPFLVIGI